MWLAAGEKRSIVQCMRRPHPNARKLRKDMPEAERRLWSRLRLKQLGGFRFRRQHTIGPFISDFVCVEAMLVIELDGAQHGENDASVRDAARDAYMEGHGYLVLRFWNEAVVKRIDDVLDEIHRVAHEGATARSFGLIGRKTEPLPLHPRSGGAVTAKP